MENLKIEQERSEPSLSTRRQSAPPTSFAIELSVEKSRYKPYVPPESDPNVNHDRENPSHTRPVSQSAARVNSHVPAVLKPGTPIERNTYPPLSLSLPSVRPRSRSTLSPATEMKEQPVVMPSHLHHVNRPRSTTGSERQVREPKLDMPHHAHFAGRSRPTTPSEMRIGEKINMPHHLQYITSPTSNNGSVNMPHHLSYTRPRSTVPTIRCEEGQVMANNSGYVPKPRAPYPTAPGVSLAQTSPEIGSRNGGWGAVPIVPQNRGPQIMMEGYRRSYYG